MAMRPKRQLIESPSGSVNTSSTSPSIASTVPMASPSVRRSARIQESPSVSYRDNLGARARETPLRQIGRSRSRSRSRIFGLDVSEQSRLLDKHSDSETEADRVEPSQSHLIASYQKLFVGKVLPILTSPRGKGVAASFLLLIMLVFTQWVVGKGIASVLSWAMWPISGLRVAMMTLPDMLFGATLGSKVEVNEEELMAKLLNSSLMTDMITNRVGEHLAAMEQEFEKKYKNEIDLVHKEAENIREMLLESEMKRLAPRENELKSDRTILQVDESKADNRGLSHDQKQKIEFVEIKIDQLKLNFVDFTKQTQVKRAHWDEEMKLMKGNIEELLKDRHILLDLDEKMKSIQGELISVVVALEAITGDRSDLEEINIQKSEAVGQNVNMDETKELIIKLVEESVNKTIESIDVFQKEVDRAKKNILELGVKVNRTDVSLATAISQIAEMKTDLRVELTEHSESLHMVWAENQLESSVSLADVSAMLGSQLSLYSSDRTGLIDWASLSLGTTIYSTPNTSNHPVMGQVFTIMGFPVWHISSSPSQILRPVAVPGQCWAFSGQEGCVVIKLGQVVRVTAVTIEHVRPLPDMSSAPKDMLLSDPEGNIPLMNLTYTIDTASSALQTFPLAIPTKLSKLKIDFISNWGQEEYTCVYRVRVHGMHEDGNMNVIDTKSKEDISMEKVIL